MTDKSVMSINIYVSFKLQMQVHINDIHQNGLTIL